MPSPGRRRIAAKSNTPIPLPTALNISALARDAGVSRRTIMRRLEKGWRPDAHAHPVQPVRTPASAAKPILAVKSKVEPVEPVFVRERTPVQSHLRPPLGVVRTVLLLLGVAFYVFIAMAAVHR